jgi:hypothetical protein
MVWFADPSAFKLKIDQAARRLKALRRALLWTPVDYLLRARRRGAGEALRQELSVDTEAQRHLGPSVWAARV